MASLHIENLTMINLLTCCETGSQFIWSHRGLPNLIATYRKGILITYHNPDFKGISCVFSVLRHFKIVKHIHQPVERKPNKKTGTECGVDVKDNQKMLSFWLLCLFLSK
jgi:hypothetical protein